MKVITDFSVTSRPLRVGAGFSPRALFRDGIEGCWCHAGIGENVFSNLTGLLPHANLGEQIARINDRSGNGRHALQPSIALRPLLGRAPKERRNLFSHTEAFDNAAWSKFLCAVTPNATTAPDGSASADLLVTNAVNSRLHRANPFNGKARFSVHARAAANGQIVFSTQAGPSGVPVFDLNEGTVSFRAGTPQFESAQIEDVGGGWYRCSATALEDVTELQLRVGEGGNTVAGEVYIWGAQIEAGETTSPYQRVGNANDMTEAGVQAFPYIRFDLADDVLSVTFPDGGTFDVILFGRDGSWLQRDVTITAGGNLNIGPDTITGGPAGLLAALGDMIGWIAVARTLTEREVSQTVAYHMARSAADLMETV